MQTDLLSTDTLKNITQLKEFVVPFEHIQSFGEKFEQSLRKASDKGELDDYSASPSLLRLVDAEILNLPSKRLDGSYFCLSIEDYGIVAAKLVIKDLEAIITKSFISYDGTTGPGSGDDTTTRLRATAGSLRLTQDTMTATIFVNTALAAIKEILAKTKTEPTTENPIPFILTSFHPISKKMNKYEFAMLEESIEKPGIDSLCNVNVLYLLKAQLEENKIHVYIKDVLSHSTARLIGTNAQVAAGKPSCLVSYHIDETIQTAFFLPESKRSAFVGGLVDVDISKFNADIWNEQTANIEYGLPYIVVDFQARAASSCKNAKPKDLDILAGSHFLTEIIRLAVIRVFKMDTPKSAWIPNSLSLEDCFSILADDAHMMKTREIIKSAWGCDDLEKIGIIRKVVVSIFSRAAALSAVLICNMAKRTGKLQSALGGVTVAMSGSMGSNTVFLNLMRFYIDKCFNKDMSGLLRLQVSHQSVHYIGAAMLGIHLSKTSKNV